VALSDASPAGVGYSVEVLEEENDAFFFACN
jgi:hypothetical protein